MIRTQSGPAGRTTSKEGDRMLQGPRRLVMPAVALALLALVAARESRAAFDSIEIDPRARAMGGAYTAADGGYLQLYHNPAGLILADKLTLGMSYVEPYSTEFIKLTAAGAAVKLPGRWGGLGLGFRHQGTTFQEVALDQENTFSLAHGVSLYKDMSSTVAVGYALHLYSLEFGSTIETTTGGSIDPGSATSVGIDLGARVTLRNRTAVGFMVQNINNPTIGDAGGEKTVGSTIVGNDGPEDLPRRVIGGVAYSPYAGVTTTLDMDAILGQKTRFRGGTEFAVTDYGFLRFGIATDPNLYSAGLGVSYHGIQFNYGFSTGPGALSNSHQFGVSLTPHLLNPAGGEE